MLKHRAETLLALSFNVIHQMSPLYCTNTRAGKWLRKA